MKELTLRRNQILIKEGEPARNIYIIKKGQFEMKKFINEKRAQNIELDLLLKNTVTQSRFNKNFKS